MALNIKVEKLRKNDFISLNYRSGLILLEP